MSAIPTRSRRAVVERSGGRCEARIRGVCRGRASVIHHVQRRRDGGHDPKNLLHLCAGPPRDGCHEFIHAHPAWAREHGFIRSAFAPTEEAS
ncbi:MAG: HNH endonuclease [Acidimicrobiia bacterium]